MLLVVIPFVERVGDDANTKYSSMRIHVLFYISDEEGNILILGGLVGRIGYL
jgi:hypothetical protein